MELAGINVKKPKVWLAAIFLVAMILRFGFLGTRSLWLDEAYSVNRANFPLTELQSGKMDPRHPPMYYIALHEWVKIAGQSETAVRFPSAAASALSLIFSYFLARRIFDEEIAFIAFGLLAFSALDIWYAQEARMYSFVALFSVVGALGLAWRNVWGAITAGAALLAGLYFDYTMVPLWTGIGAVWLADWWRRGRPFGQLVSFLLATAFAALLFWPMAPHLWRNLSRLDTVHFFMSVKEILGIGEFTAVEYSAILVLIGFGLTIGVYAALNLLRNPTLRRIVAGIILVGYLLAVLALLTPRFYTAKRILVTGWPFLVLIVAWFIYQSGRNKRVWWAGLVAVSLLSAVVTTAVPKDDWRSLVTYSVKTINTKDTLWIDPRWNTIAFEYYAPQYPTMTEPAQSLPDWAEQGDVWLVAERYLGQVIPTSESEIWLDENMELVEAIPFNRLELRHYR